MADTAVTIIGNLTDDPELRYTPSGAPVANARVAVTPRVRDGDDWKDGDTSFFRIVVWRDMAENFADSLQKGDRVVVVGRLAIRTWETPEGENRSAAEITAEEISPSLKWATVKVEKVRGKREEKEESPRPQRGSRRRVRPAKDEPPF